MEVDGRNGGNGIHAQRFRVGGQFLGIGGVVAGNVGNDGDLALGLSHNVLQNHLTLFLALVDALTGGTAHIQALNALADEIPGQVPDSLGADIAFFVIASIEGGNNTLKFCSIHIITPKCRYKI